MSKESGTGTALKRDAVRDDRLAVALNEVKGLVVMSSLAPLGTAQGSAAATSFASSSRRVLSGLLASSSAHFAPDDCKGD